MRWPLFKGFWDRWLKDEDTQLRQWFRELDSYLSRAFRNRISLRDNMFCKIYEQENVPVNIDVEVQQLLDFPLEGAVVLESSEPGSLTWSQREKSLTFRFTTTASSLGKIKLCLFFRGEM